MENTRYKRDPQETKTIILKKAVKLFMTKGFQATSTNDICLAAKLTKPTLYYYFKSKNHLLLSVHMRVISEILQPYMKKVAAIEEPYERLKAIIRDYSLLVCLHPEFRFILHDSLVTKGKYFKQIKVERKKFYLLLRNTIDELQSTGKIKSSIRPSWAALHMIGMITWMTYWFDYKSKDKIDAIADAAIEMIFHGVCPVATSDKSIGEEVVFSGRDTIEALYPPRRDSLNNTIPDSTLHPLLPLSICSVGGRVPSSSPPPDPGSGK
jgi:AcrR family transcriptional regulator